MIGRRDLICAAGAAAAIRPLVARAQPDERVRRIGVLTGNASYVLIRADEIIE